MFQAFAEKQQETLVVIPSKTADWFDPDSITSIEKDSLPEFFQGYYPSKTPQTYREYRDFMIALYQMDPKIYLSFTTVRRHLSGDVSALMRIHRFLELHGLINFNVDPQQKPLNKELLRESCYEKVLINAANKHFLQKSEEEFIHTLFDAPESVVTQE